MSVMMLSYQPTDSAKFCLRNVASSPFCDTNPPDGPNLPSADA
jgi:hypothetical protein